MNRNLILAGVLFAGLAASANNTNYWTNATGDGKWSNTNNWSLAELPGASDYVSLCHPTAYTEVNIDVEGGVKIGALIVTNKAAVITGEKLTLRGGWRGSAWGGKNYAGTQDLWCLWSRVRIVFENEVEFHPSGETHVQVDNVSDAHLHFRKPVAFLHDNGSYKRFVLEADRSSALYFYSTLNVTGAFILACNSNVHFYQKVTATSVDKSGWTGGNYYFYAQDNDLGASFPIAYNGCIHPMTTNCFSQAMRVNFQGSNAYSSGSNPNTGDGINLNGYDVTVDRLTSSWVPTWAATYLQHQANIWSHDVDAMPYNNIIYRPAATLALRGTTNAWTMVALWDRVSLKWDPVDDFTQVLSNCESRTSGNLIVKRGTLAVVGNATFKNLHMIDIASDATFLCDTSAAGAFAGLDRVRIGAGGTLRVGGHSPDDPFSGHYACGTLAVGATVDTAKTVKFAALEYDGAYVADGTYTADGADETTQAPWVSGAGKVVVQRAASQVAVWNAADGNWSDSENWLDGYAPDVAGCRKAIVGKTGGNYTATLDKDLTLPGRFEVWNDGAGVAKVSVETNATDNGGFISADVGGKIEVPAGGAIRYDGAGTSYSAESATPIRIHGGEFVTSGGWSCFSNVTGGASVGGYEGLKGRVAVTAGQLIYHTTCANNSFTVDLGSEFALSGTGRFHCGSSDSTSQMKTSECFAEMGGVFSVRDSAWFNPSRATYDWYTAYKRGTTPLLCTDDSRMFVKAGDYGRLTVSGGKTLRFEGTSSFTNAPGQVAINGTLELLSNAKHGNLGYEMNVGSESGTKAVVRMTDGAAGCVSRGLFIGGSTANNQFTVGCEGRFYLSGGAFTCNGDNSNNWGGNNPNGLLIGYGARTVMRCGRPYVGLLDVSGGTFTQNSGGVIVGAGYGKGDLRLSGTGALSYGGTRPTVVGLCGGLGDMIVSNGTYSAKKSDLYVGGAPITVFPDGNGYVAAGYPDFRHDADGKLTVAGGSVTVDGSSQSGMGCAYVGLDGRGEIEMIGTVGTLTVSKLFCTNQTESVLSFVCAADGVSPITVKNTFQVSDGLTVKVDFTDYAGKKTKLPLVTYKSIEGDLAQVKVEAIGVEEDVGLVAANGKLCAHILRGSLLIVR